MHNTEALLEFVRGQRQLLGDMEKALSQVICDLHDVATLEKNIVGSEDALMQQMYQRNVIYRKKGIRRRIVEYNEQLQTLCLYHQAYCETLPDRKTATA